MERADFIDMSYVWGIASSNGRMIIDGKELKNLDYMMVNQRPLYDSLYEKAPKLPGLNHSFFLGATAGFESVNHKDRETLLEQIWIDRSAKISGPFRMTNRLDIVIGRDGKEVIDNNRTSGLEDLFTLRNKLMLYSPEFVENIETIIRRMNYPPMADAFVKGVFAVVIPMIARAEDWK